MLIEAAEMLRVASRERDKIAAGDVRWVRYRSAAERSFWRAFKAFHDGRKPAKGAKPTGSRATVEVAKSEPSPAEAARVEAETSTAATPAPEPAPAAPPAETRRAPATAKPAPGAAVSPAEAKAEPKPRPTCEDVLLSKPVWVIKNLLEATAPRPNYSYLDISAARPQGGPTRDGSQEPRAQRA